MNRFVPICLTPLAILVPMLVSCANSGPGPVDEPEGKGPRSNLPLIVAHRGASHDAPENTLAAFEFAWQHGADAFECDVRLTADGRVVCLHDADTGRTGNGGGPKGSGLVASEHTLQELQAVDVGRWKSPDFAGQSPPSLDAALATVPNDGRVFIEVKAGPEILPALLESVEQSGLTDDQVTVISFDADVVAAVKAARPGWTVNWLTSFERDNRGAWAPTIDQIVRQLRAVHADGLGCKAVFEHVDGHFVATLRQHGFGFHLWTINDVAAARAAVALGVDSVTTDRPGVIRDGLSGAPAALDEAP